MLARIVGKYTQFPISNHIKLMLNISYSKVWLILGAGFNILCISCLRLLWPSCNYHFYVLLAYTYYVGGQVCCGSGEKGFTRKEDVGSMY